MSKCKRIVSLLLAAAMMLQMNITALAEVSLPGVHTGTAQSESTPQAAQSTAGKTASSAATGSDLEEAEESTADSAAESASQGEPAQSDSSESKGTENAPGSESESSASDSLQENSQPAGSEAPENGENAAEEQQPDDMAMQADAAPAAAASGYDFTAADGSLREALQSAGMSNWTLNADSTIATMQATSYNSLIVLSHADPELYQNATITISVTGGQSADLTANQQYSFWGLGSEEHPFAGTIQDSGNSQITNFTLNRALFNGVKLTAQNNKYILNFTDNSLNPGQSIFADYIVTEGENVTLALTVNRQDQEEGPLTKPFVGTVNGDLHLELIVGESSQVDITGYNIEQEENAGIIANTVASGTLTVTSAKDNKSNSSLLQGKTLSVTSNTKNAGLLVGEVAENAGFVWPENSAIAENSTAKVTGAASAGGLVGAAGKSAQVTIGSAVSASSLTVTANTENAGGVVGAMGEGAAFTITDKTTFSGTVNGQQDAGGLAGTLGAGAALTLGGVSMATQNSTLAITATNGNAGGAVGTVSSTAENPVKLNFTGNVTLSGSVSGSASAGGFAGAAGTGMAITLTPDQQIDLCGITSVTGANVGGFAGMAQDMTIAADESGTAVTAKITPAQGTLGDTTNTANVGGWFGTYTATTGDETETIKLTNAFTESIGSDTNPIQLYIKASGNAGGLFGVLTLGKENEEQGVRFAVEEKKIFATWFLKEHTARSEDTLGGIAGKVTGQSKKDTLVVKECEETRNKVKNSSQAKYNGGLVGKVQNAAIEAYDFTANEPYPYSSNGSFGGVVGYLDEYCVLIAHNTTLSTKIANQDKDGSIWDDNGSGGVVGKACKGSVVQLSGKTNLEYVWFNASSAQMGTVGLLVGMQDDALIYALGSGSDYDENMETGWTLLRSKNKKEKNNGEGDKRATNMVDDIGNYGEVYRLHENGLAEDLFALDKDTHEIRLKEEYKNQNDSGDITLKDKNEFALFAIAVQSEGTFFNNGSSLTSIDGKTISITDDIDLSGTGVTGISRDNGSQTCNNIKLNGNDHSITLAIGEKYGKSYNVDGNEVADGSYNDGRVFGHLYVGLFSKVDNLKVSNLTINENIRALTRISKGDKGGEYYYLGAVAAYSSGNSALTGCTVNTNIEQGGAYYRAGGIFGYVEGGEVAIENTKVTVNYSYDGDTKLPCNNNETPFDNKIDALKEVSIGGAIGYLESGATANFNGLTLSGDIKPQGEKDYTGSNFTAGGLIAYAQKATVNIQKVTIDNFTMESSAADSMGGFAGYQWDNCTVNIEPEKDDQTEPAFKIVNSKLESTSAEMGGLIWRTSGKWKIGANGIDFGSAENDTTTLSTKGDLGVLICHGEPYNNDTTKAPDKALYLNMTANWEGDENAYMLGENVVPKNSTHTVFDELIAFTAAKDVDITQNGQSLISLATTKPGGSDERKVIMDGENCNTYQNRTAYGKAAGKTNSHSRYYYNLDAIQEKAAIKDSETKGDVNTPERLMLWSVRWYIHSALADYFTYQGDTITGSLDMNGYSYYPIHLVNNDLTIGNAQIRFYNQQIETSENNQNDKKITSEVTQHYTMHAGLLLSYQQTNTTSANDITLRVTNSSISGSVGKLEDGTSGALVCGPVAGNSLGKANISIDGLTLYDTVDGKPANALFVTGHEEGEQNPLLIGSITGYSTANISGVKADAAALPKGVTNAASSLIGPVGGTEKNENDQTVLTFSKIVLPDTNGYFTSATLLQSFQVGTGLSNSAIYNFNSNEDTAGNKQVTYGKEISGSNQYHEPGQQKWYYDKAGEAKDEGLVKDKTNNSTDFSSYLPYVSTGYDAAKFYEEIKVNHVVVNFIEHCGTYSDPYVINSAAQLSALSAYTRGIGRPEYITIVDPDSANEFAFCDGANEKHHRDYWYDGSNWVSGTVATDASGIASFTKDEAPVTLTDAMVQDYIRNAYYKIVGELSVTDFGGLGLSTAPFRGVLVGDANASITLKGSSMSLIQYSYGSVVKDLRVSYAFTEDEPQKGRTLAYTAPSDGNWNYALPGSFFGGVIGCVLGGDNIIDGVTVSYADGWLTLASSLNATETENNDKHLIPVGGYVGEVAGGGVIFRNQSNQSNQSNAGTGGIVMQGASLVNDGGLYHNPLIGRVLNGFAFSEGFAFIDADQGSNYKVNQITPDTANQIGVSGNTVTLKNAQSLLVFSAIVNSGAAGQNATNAANSSIAYYGNGAAKAYPDANNIKYSFGGSYGKSRTAQYNSIGNVTSATDDWKLAANDDCKKPEENSPYLISAYAANDAKTALQALTASTANIALTQDTTYDMTGYGSGYQGIGGRYRSIAMLNSSNRVDFATNPVRMKLANFTGNSAVITVDMQVTEYANDDFPASAVGAVFNAVGFMEGTAQNFTLQNCQVVWKYVDAGGNDATASTNSSYASLGGFAGRNAPNGDSKCSYTFSGIAIVGENSDQPSKFTTKAGFAGGLIGSTNVNAKDSINNLNSNYEMALSLYKTGDTGNTTEKGIKPTFTDCRYSNIQVEAIRAAGGFLGWQNENQTIEVNTSHTGEDALIAAQNGRIQAAYAGGSFGYCKGSVTIGQDETAKIRMETVTVNQENKYYSPCIGGLVGYVNNTAIIINVELANETIKNTPSSTPNSGTSTGGILGFGNSTIEIKKSTVENAQITGNKKNTGGLIGYATSKITISDTSVQKLTLSGKAERLGGLVGYAGGVTTITETKLEYKSIDGGTNTGGMIGYANNTATITNSSVTGSSDTAESTITGNTNTGGMIGYANNTATITSSSVTGSSDTAKITITGKGDKTGGMVGYGNNTITVTGSEDSPSKVSYADITGSGKYVGGMVGYGKGEIEISNAKTSNADITNSAVKSGDTVTAYVSGMAAYASSTLNADTVTVRDTTLTITNKDTEDQAITSTISSGNTELSGGVSGGVVAFAQGNATIQNATITNLIAKTGKSIGGIAGRLYGAENKIQGAKVAGKTVIGSNDITGTDAPQVNGPHNIGGILGTFRNRCTISDSSVIDATIETPKGFHTENTDINSSAGGMVGEVGSNYTVIFQNCLVKNTHVNAAEDKITEKKYGSAAGGLVGAVYGRMNASNIRIQNTEPATGTTINNNQPKGYLFGKYRPEWNRDPKCSVYVAGLSVQKPENTNVDCSKMDNYYGLIGLNNENDTPYDVNYIAMADYTGAGAADNRTKTTLFDEADDNMPYAVTSPLQGPQVAGGKIYGDGTAYTQNQDDTTFTLQAQTILQEAKTPTQITDQSRFAYQKISDKTLDSSLLSDYNANNTVKLDADQNFPVLQISGSDANTQITKYLDIVTNGGYSEALTQNTGAAGGQYVTASVETWAYNGNQFINKHEITRSGQDGLRTSIRVTGSGTTSMSFASTYGYDNDQQRFSLLAVKFSATGSANTAADYTVYVPIIVRRVLQVSTIATLNQGTVFTENAYANLGKGDHVLESTGNTVTALITYTYGQENRNGTLQKQDYDWNSILSSGGSMGAPNKTIRFIAQAASTGSANQSIPAGTQLTLIDNATKRAYTYTLQQGDITGNNAEVPFTSFKDADENPYAEKWLSELMQVAAAQSATGAWVEAGAGETATAKAKLDGEWKSFRPAEETTDSGMQHYDLTQSSIDTPPSESFYLVMYIPTQQSEFYSNGSLVPSMAPDGVKTDLNLLLRSDNTKDNQQSTASTYSFLSGYTQVLKDMTKTDMGYQNNAVELQPTDVAGTNWRLPVDVQDTITFRVKQANLFSGSDALYYQMQTTLLQTKGSEKNGTNLQAGANGTVWFYITTGTGENTKYWHYDPSGSTEAEKWISSDEKTTADSYAWAGTGDIMQLTLGGDTPLNLRGLLDNLRSGAGQDDERSFVIHTVFEQDDQKHYGVNMTQDVYQAAIMAAGQVTADNPDNYTQVNYRGILATKPDTLHYSSMTEQKLGDIQYYRSDSNAATIQLTADDTDQLGINCSELASADGTIDLTGVYSLEKLSDADNVMENAHSALYTLTLEKRQEDGNYTKVDGDISRYIDAAAADKLGRAVQQNGESSLTWTDSELALQQGDKNEFQIKLHLKVNTDVLGETNTGYANYRLRLQAELLNANGQVVNIAVNYDAVQNGRIISSDQTSTEYYRDHTDYVTYTLTKINLEIDPSQFKAQSAG